MQKFSSNDTKLTNVNYCNILQSIEMKLIKFEFVTKLNRSYINKIRSNAILTIFDTFQR